MELLHLSLDCMLLEDPRTTTTTTTTRRSQIWKEKQRSTILLPIQFIDESFVAQSRKVVFPKTHSYLEAAVG